MLTIVLILLGLILLFGFNAVKRGAAGITIGFISLIGIVLIAAIVILLFVIFRLAAIIIIPIGAAWWWWKGRNKITVLRDRWPNK